MRGAGDLAQSVGGKGKAGWGVARFVHERNLANGMDGGRYHINNHLLFPCRAPAKKATMKIKTAELLNAVFCGNITGNMKKPSVLLDTNILVAGLSSRNGASFQLLRHCFDGKFEIIASVPLWLEYEAILKRAEIRKMHGLSARDIDDLLNNLAVAVRPTTLHYLWRPQLSDPGDEMVLETALNGAADALVTFNFDDFQPAADRFGLRLLRPADFLNTLKRNKP